MVVAGSSSSCSGSCRHSVKLQQVTVTVHWYYWYLAYPKGINHKPTRAKHRAWGCGSMPRTCLEPSRRATRSREGGQGVAIIM